jgi:hypothetical protein
LGAVGRVAQTPEFVATEPSLAVKSILVVKSRLVVRVVLIRIDWVPNPQK